MVFALDSALMCDGSYLGRMGESLIWAYGPDSLSDYAGVCVIGNRIDENDLEERHGIRYTNFNRTLNDSLANERILDMQGITEALSRYYTAHNDSFEGLHPDPEYLDAYNRLKSDAADYYTY